MRCCGNVRGCDIMSYLFLKAICVHMFRVFFFFFYQIPEIIFFLIGMPASSCVLPCLHWNPYLFFISETSIFIFIRSDNQCCVLLLFVHCVQLGFSESCVLILFFLSLLFFFFMWLHIFLSKQLSLNFLCLYYHSNIPEF